MKKFITLIAVALVGIAGAFAFDLGDIKGTWTDAGYKADWTFSGNGTITISDSETGTVYFVFSDDNVQNFKLSAGLNGVTVSFDCAATARSYSFTKGLSLSTDLDYVVKPIWTSEYSTKITWKK